MSASGYARVSPGRPPPRRGLGTRGPFRARAPTGEGAGGGSHASPAGRRRAGRGEPRLANGAGAGVHGRSADAGIAETLCSLAILPQRNSALFSSDCLAGDRRWHDLARQGTVREAQRMRIPWTQQTPGTACQDHWRESHGWRWLLHCPAMRRNTPGDPLAPGMSCPRNDTGKQGSGVIA
jgi:hypothetical protein